MTETQEKNFRAKSKKFQANLDKMGFDKLCEKWRSMTSAEKSSPEGKKIAEAMEQAFYNA